VVSKKKVMSLSIEPAMHDKLKAVAEKKADGNVSKILCDLVDKYLITDDTVTAVVLKVPNALKTDRAALAEWLTGRSAAIVKALTSN
jgi:hypothetical protein